MNKVQDTNQYTESVAFLYTNNKLLEKANKKKISFTVASKSLKYLEINLTNEVKTCTLKTIRHQ